MFDLLIQVLLLDKETTGMVSIVYTQSEILQKEVYLVDRLETPNRETMTHLKAICFLRPTPENVTILCRELRKPKYGQYYIFFSNTLSSGDLERLAEADEHEVVREVQEMFGDYYAINNDLISLNVRFPSISSMDKWDDTALRRSVQGFTSLLLSLKKRPLIRYQSNSNMCKKLATEMSSVMQNESSLFDFRRTDSPPLMIILDRRDDCVTPLLNQWTYQAMVHERLGITNQRVSLAGAPGIKKDMQDMVLSSETDEFYHKNMFENFGDIGMSIKKLVDSFQEKTKSNKKIDTIADMRSFIDTYPQFRQMSSAVSKHVTVVGELSRLMDAHRLLEVSETEQDIACQGDHSSILTRVRQLIDADKVTDMDRARLILLYALRFDKSNTNYMTSLVEQLKHRHLDSHYISLVRHILTYGGYDARQSDLFGNKSFFAFTKKTLKGLKGVQNVYTQHEPLLIETLDLLVKGKLKDSDFPFLGPMLRDKPQDIIVMMVGGATYEEARFVSRFNSELPGTRIILAGTHVHNAESFMEQVMVAAEGETSIEP
ncbi:vacuolar protein sorting-associated protein 45 [Sphaeroforma arctica JP610]|uniref:Vacuolar protein sorting-associated protein 45 n=1 Tax=Sphaeroforma arctica JP610 TaxID=667725 RepID=A0A0L0FG50_9EUKA|nr:vacuolar protein sorting-associated protein 45 [Sphaeroforma arctica JP610]KNC75018.1 vacuolar protein sorting-associated protein 45 [Sphaeroforma arctica JP610]|eukprot:XP_014148920.1 vacuolar protein sorting-associated protein 45 [Sphaeroforma arctica JP610]